MFGILTRLIGRSRGFEVTARLNARLQPLDRGDVFEDPLDELLQANGLGKVTGGGTMLSETGEMEFCDVEITVPAMDEPTLQGVIANLEKLGAPCGSKLMMANGAMMASGDRDLPFGKTEGLAVYLNGTDLDDSVYVTCDVNFVVSELGRLTNGISRYQSYWQGTTETALYLYGENAEGLRKLILPFLEEYPLCEKARTVQIA